LLNKIPNVEVSDTYLPAGRQPAMPHGSTSSPQKAGYQKI